jgi:putative oxidoreductase
MKRVIILDVICSLFIILFLYTGLYKILDQAGFRSAVGDSPILSHYQGLIGISIPVLEILIGGSLLFTIFKDNHIVRKWALRASFVLMALFTLYIGYMLLYTPHHLPCSCGGIIQQMNWHQHFYFNTAFTILSLIGLRLNNKIGQANSQAPFTANYV